MEEKIVGKLRDVLATDFPATEEAYGQYHNELAASRAPAAEVAFNAQA